MPLFFLLKKCPFFATLIGRPGALYWKQERRDDDE